MTGSKHTLVVISYYDRRPIDNLVALIKTLETHEACSPFDVCVVVNRTSDREIQLPDFSMPVQVVYRPNLGMNIGAWDYGWRVNSGYQHYLFLQDECYAIREQWLSSFKQKLAETNAGLVGESLNSNWDRNWNQLRVEQEKVVMPEHEINGKRVNRVDFYLNYLRSQQTSAGPTGRHMRSLVWFLGVGTLEKINGFPIGRNYGECIAAEITVSKKVESLGLSIVQVDAQPFSYFRHVEWNQDCAGAPFTHKSVYLKKLNAIKEQIERPTWIFTFQVLRNRLRIPLDKK